MSSSSAAQQKNYLDSIHNFPKQFKEAWSRAYALEFPFEYSNISDVVIAGMGGSAFGGWVSKAVFAEDKMLVPLEVVNRYELPGYADEKTLVVATSYSGNTEETLAIIKQARERGCKIVIISTGGKLGNVLLSEKYPGYVFDPKFNPSGSPRTGIGYVIGATLGLLSNLKLLDYSQKEFTSTLSFIESFSKYIAKDSQLVEKMAQKLHGFAPIFVSAEHLTAATYIWRNFFNETSKNIAFTYEIPEMNHHFLDSLIFPEGAKESLAFVFIKSDFYNVRNRRRLEISREVVKKFGFTDISISLSSESKINQAWELIIIGAYVSFHMAKIHSVNPGSNDYVDFLKANLG